MTDAQVTTAISNIATGSPNSASEMRELLTELFNRGYKTGDVMMVSCPNQYIIDNFDGTGLGIALRVGWAICNGANGTRDYNDRLPLPYGTSNVTMGALKGENTATLISSNLPPINVPYTGSDADNGDNGSFIITANSQSNGTHNLSAGGTSVAFSIENKSIVTLFIQKI
jgi:hypothetical protein